MNLLTQVIWMVFFNRLGVELNCETSLDEKQIKELEKPISESEVVAAMSKIKEGKVCATDGFPIKFYKPNGPYIYVIVPQILCKPLKQSPRVKWIGCNKDNP